MDGSKHTTERWAAVTDGEASLNQAKTRLLRATRDIGGDDLRDVWVFSQAEEESLYLREDVGENLAQVEVDRYIDNERYGYVTRETYDRLSYANYRFTVRGFDEFDQVRTFVADDDLRVGVLASFDRRDGGYDYAELDRSIVSIRDRYGVDALRPGR